MGISIYNTPLSERQHKEYMCLLEACGLRDEGDADIVALMTEDGDLIACGALAGRTVKQLAVDSDAEGQGAMAAVLSALIAEAYARGIHRLFLCTKPENLRMFRSMGFHTVIETTDAVLLENRKDGLESFLASIPKYDGVCGAVVCNCDPFTLGHRHLIEYAASHCDNLYVFAVSEKGSMFSPEERLEMIRKGTADIENCHVFESDLYLISRATFPAYFIRDESRADLVKSDLDIELFCRRIAPALKKQFNYTSVMQIPVLKKIVVNQGLGAATADKKIIEVGIEELTAITGQKAVATISKKDVANFKLRKKMPVGVRVTLRRERMYEFLEKLVKIALPRIRDFKGIAGKFDGRGNITCRRNILTCSNKRNQ